MNTITATAAKRTAIKRPKTGNPYQALLGHTWQQLKPEIRQRFANPPTTKNPIVYSGVIQVYFNFFGWLFAQFCRLIGKPLALYQGRDVPIGVMLTVEPDHGVRWTRHYCFDQAECTVGSTKRFNPNGWLEEHIGFGFLMQLKVFEDNGNLYFLSQGYYWEKGGMRIRIPDWLTPGTTIVGHEQIDGPRFRFVLSVTHRWLGQTFYQCGEFS